MAGHELRRLRPPRARCSCGRRFELDAYAATKPPRVQEDALIDMYNDHARAKAAAEEQLP